MLQDPVVKNFIILWTPSFLKQLPISDTNLVEKFGLTPKMINYEATCR